MKKTSVVRKFQRYQNYRTRKSPSQKTFGPSMRSGFERTLAAQMKRVGVLYEYEPIKLPYVLERTYCPDFKLPNGIYIEAKGKLDQDTRSKMVAVRRAHPELDIRIVFMRGTNKLSKGSKQTYMQWGEKNGFICADGAIPESWFSE